MKSFLACVALTATAHAVHLNFYVGCMVALSLWTWWRIILIELTLQKKFADAVWRCKVRNILQSDVSFCSMCLMDSFTVQVRCGIKLEHEMETGVDRILVSCPLLGIFLVLNGQLNWSKSYVTHARHQASLLIVTMMWILRFLAALILHTLEYCIEDIDMTVQFCPRHCPVGPSRSIMIKVTTSRRSF